MLFEYKALKKDGEILTGEREGTTSNEVTNILKEEGLVIISIHEKNKKIKNLSLNFRAFGAHEKIMFTRNIASMLDAGLALSRALEVIARQTKNTKTKKVIEEINARIKTGTPLSTAFEAYPNIFTPIIVSMTQAGEESGNLSEAFKNISLQLEKNYLLMKKIKGALVYPGVIVSAMVLVGFFMMTNIVPTLSGTFIELEIDLPTSTQFIIALSDFLQHNTIAFFGILIGLIVGLIAAAKSVTGKKVFDFIFVKTPAIGQITKEINSARTARTLSSLLEAGVPYLQSIQITKGVVSNHFYKNILEEAEKKIEVGEKVSSVFTKHENFYPPFFGEMIAVGEETGDISAMLLHIAEYYEEEVEQKTKNISTIIEPILMLVVGVGVGFFAISMISPMYSLLENI